MKKLYFAPLTIIALVLFAQSAVAQVTIELEPSSRVILHVDPGMSIDQIVRKVYPTEVELWLDIKNRLIELNPYSFHPNSDRLVAGSRLKLVEIKRVAEQVVSNKSKVGYVARQKGRVTVKDLNGETQILETNSPIYEGDRITTGMGSTAYIAMDDGAEIYLKEDSVIKISTYVITSEFDKDSSSVLDLIRGGLRKITGSIGASALSNYQVQTGLATIGIRGTSMCFGVRPPRTTLSQFAMISTPSPETYACRLPASRNMASPGSRTIRLSKAATRSLYWPTVRRSLKTLMLKGPKKR